MLAACAGRHEPIVRVTPASVPGTALPAEGMESVRYAENLKTYPLGRYVDPNNPGIMHEGHSVYRVETTAKWNLHPNPASPVSSGPVTRVRDTAKSPVLLRDELFSELNRQKEATKAVIQSGQTVTQKLGELASAVQQTRQTAGQNTRLQKEIDSANRRLDLLEEAARHPSPEPSPKDGAASRNPLDW